jgi:DNA invertase Pin-like site-specific DNA recombinase
MSKIFAYLRVSTHKQDLNNQRLEILDYAHQQHLEIHDFIELTISSQKTQKERRIDELLHRLEAGDTLLVTELSRLGRSTGQVISLIDQLLAAKIQVHILKQNLRLDLTQTDLQSRATITLFSLFAEMERMLISQRTREALASKKSSGDCFGKT